MGGAVGGDSSIEVEERRGLGVGWGGWRFMGGRFVGGRGFVTMSSFSLNSTAIRAKQHAGHKPQ